MKGNASRIFMVRPVMFGFNEQTAGSNSFQNKAEKLPEEIQQEALKEFDHFTEKLKAAGINVTVFEDTTTPHTPDSIFPNNWISFNGDAIVLYPMLAPNRRLEKRKDIIEYFKHPTSYLMDLSENEKENAFLEGTGSIVFDYENKLAFANISPRTSKTLLAELCNWLNYEPVTFRAVDASGKDIYHTNVLMCIGQGFAVLCNECIPDRNELKKLIKTIESTGREIIAINYEQMNSFAGNMYQLFNASGESFIVMSEQAYRSLKKEQVEQLEKYGTLLYAPLYTIEKYGGGSARCMMAEVK